MHTKQLWIAWGLGFGMMLVSGASALAQDRDRSQDQVKQADPRHQGALGVSLRESGGRLRVSAVVADSPAARAGIRVGDEIISVDSQTVGTAQQLIAEVVKRQPGTQVNLGVRRNAQRHTILASLVSVDALRSQSANAEGEQVNRQIRALQRQISLLEQAVRETRQSGTNSLRGNGNDGWYYQVQPDDPNQGIHDYGARARDGQ